MFRIVGSGAGPLWGRGLSAALGAATVAAVMGWAGLLFGERAATWAGWISRAVSRRDRHRRVRAQRSSLHAVHDRTTGGMVAIGPAARAPTGGAALGLVGAGRRTSRCGDAATAELAAVYAVGGAGARCLRWAPAPTERAGQRGDACGAGRGDEPMVGAQLPGRRSLRAHDVASGSEFVRRSQPCGRRQQQHGFRAGVCQCARARRQFFGGASRR